MIRVTKITNEPAGSEQSSFRSMSDFRIWLSQWEDSKIELSGHPVSPYRRGTTSDCEHTLKNMKCLYFKPDNQTSYIVDFRPAIFCK
jgi:hypothetical protein